MAISITDKAATKVQDYLKQVSDQSLALRVFVKAGGCAGYQFGLKLDKSSPTDVVEHRNGVNIVADTKSADLLGVTETSPGDRSSRSLLQRVQRERLPRGLPDKRGSDRRI